MTIAVFEVGTNSAKGIGPTLSVPVLTDIPAGSLIVVCVGSAGGSNPSGGSHPTTVIDSAGNDYYYHSQILVSGADPEAAILHAWNSLDLPAGSTITVEFNNTNSESAQAMAVFYATGARVTSDPNDNTASRSNVGSGSSPTVILAAPPAVANSLVVECLVTHGPATDNFVQDTVFTTPPVRVGTSGHADHTNVTLAGGMTITSAQIGYTPSITARDWALQAEIFAPA